MPIAHIVVQWPRLGPYHLVRLRASQRAFAREGIRLTALESAADDETYAWRRETAEESFERVQAFPDRTYESVPPTLMRRRLLEILDRLDPDAVAINTYSYPDSQACLEWCRRKRRVAVVMADSKADDAPRVWARERFKSVIVGGYDAGLVAGSPHREYLASLGLPDQVMHTGCDVVDNEYFASGARSARARPEAWRHLPGLGSDDPFFLASNRFIVRKNLPRLLDAYARYREARARPWRLVLLGDGPLRAELEERVARAGPEGVTFAGFRQIDEIGAYYGLARAFVHPASRDQWGLVVNEAMAAGLPVIVSKGAGCSTDLVRPGMNGFVFDPEDVDELATCLKRMDGPEADLQAMGARSKHIIAGWSPDRFAASLLAAARSGEPRSRRPFGWRLRIVLTVLRLSSRWMDAFYTVEA